MTIVTVLQPAAPNIVTKLAAGDESVVLRTALAGAVRHTVTTLNAGTPGPCGAARRHEHAAHGRPGLGWSSGGVRSGA
jgi:hypothetical protein